MKNKDEKSIERLHNLGWISDKAKKIHSNELSELIEEQEQQKKDLISETPSDIKLSQVLSLLNKKEIHLGII